jgi:hypothetical protein
MIQESRCRHSAFVQTPLCGSSSLETWHSRARQTGLQFRDSLQMKILGILQGE